VAPSRTPTSPTSKSSACNHAAPSLRSWSVGAPAAGHQDGLRHPRP
jgi:hypothetical protein